MAVFHFLLFLSFLSFVYGSKVGFICYCPCMGRFGNQMEQFLGTLAFAKTVNLTLLLSPIVHYVDEDPGHVRIPFNLLFNVTSLAAYHPYVMPLETFIKENASEIWPQEKRYSFCHSYYDYGDKRSEGSSSKQSCNAKHGRPFEPFWDAFGVNFVDSVFYSPLDVFKSSRREWRRKYYSTKYPVWAFSGHPGYFPMLKEHLPLQQYLQWSDVINQRVEEFIRDNLPRPFLAIHLRNNIDFKRACEHLVQDKDPPKNPQHLFSSAQCHGYNFEHSPRGLTREQCFPSPLTIFKDALWAARKVNARSVFVATDHSPMIKELKELLKVPIVSNYPKKDDLYLDMAILGRADLALLNCPSSFSAFAKRERDVRQLPSVFLAFSRFQDNEISHDEI